MKYFILLFGSFVFFFTNCGQSEKSFSEKKISEAPTEKSINQQFSSFDSINIAYTDEGEGDVVILLHGFISNGSSWNKSALKKDLLEKGFRVIVPDLRGNGKSDQPADPSFYSNDAEVKDLVKLADHLNVEKYIAVGYSRGSIVLSKLLTQESRIKKAVIGGMGLDFTNPNWDRRIMFAEAFGGKTPLNEITKGAVEYAQSINANLQILSWLQEFQPVTAIEELKKVQTQILVLAGDEDTDNGSPADLQQYLPNSKLKIIKGDHNNTYKAENFSEAVMQYILEKS